MTKLTLILCCWLVCLAPVLGAEVLMVADEFPAMKVLAERLKAEAKVECQIVAQTEMPPALAKFSAVIVYIHRNLNAGPEMAFIEYANQGGKLILLHHSISSGKAANKNWFHFLGVSLPKGDVDQGGYKWIEGVTLEVVNLAPNHFITTNQVKYPGTLVYASSDRGGGEKSLPGFSLPESEVYLNHTWNGPRTVLLGLKYTDAKSGKTYMQDRAGWYKPAGKGWIFYFMPGHSVKDFENPAYGQMVVNAFKFKP